MTDPRAPSARRFVPQVSPLLLTIALSGASLADTPAEPFDTVSGQIAAQATDTMTGFIDRAADVAWAGGDTLALPTGDRALTRLSRQLPLRRLFTAGEAAFHGAGYDRLVITGVEIADRALRFAGRPTGLRLQGSSRLIQGTAPSGVRFTGRGVTVAMTGAGPVSDDFIAGFSIGMDYGAARTGNGTGALISHGWSAAAQLGWRPAPDTAVSLTVGSGLASRAIAHGQGAVTADTEARRDFAALHAEHVFASEGFRLTPSSTLQLTSEARDGYTDSAGAQFDDAAMVYGRLSARVEAGYAFDLGRGSLDVFAQLGGDWDFLHPGRVTLATGRWNHGLAAGARAAGGVTLSTGTGFAGTVELSNNLIGPGGLNDTRLQGRLGFGF